MQCKSTSSNWGCGRSWSSFFNIEFVEPAGVAWQIFSNLDKPDSCWACALEDTIEQGVIDKRQILRARQKLVPSFMRYHSMSLSARSSAGYPLENGFQFKKAMERL